MKKALSLVLCAIMIVFTVLPASAASQSTLAATEVLSVNSETSSLFAAKACKYCGVKHDVKTDFWNSIYHKLLYFLQSSLFADLLVDVKNVLRIKRDVTNTKLQGALGWEGDVDAPIVYVDGSYTLRGNGNKLITFYEYNLKRNSVEWYCSENYLPCWISKFTAEGMEWKISNFCDLVTIDGKDFEVMYTRVNLRNISSVNKKVPSFSQELTCLSGSAAEKLSPGESITLDYCIGSDRFGADYDYPTGQELKTKGGFYEHYEHMKNYWNERLTNIVNIEKLPEEYSDLANAYKAGYIYTLIIADGYQLHVGENGYDRVFDHDVIGILATLLHLGHTEHFAEYADTILQNIQYPDAAWKFSWPFALYLLKTGDYDTILSYWNNKGEVDGIKSNTHKIAAERVVYSEEIKDRNGEVARIMKRTDAIDSNGYWTVDNYSSLLGLTTYAYLCQKLYENSGDEEYKNELEWAKNEYSSLLYSVEAVLSYTMDKYDISYIPISMEMPNELGERKNVLDANWASIYEFGRWDWDGYLFCADQDIFMNELIDDTYEYIINAKKDALPCAYTMGGYTGVSSGYNAGYYSAALSGEKYRTYGIEAYRWLLNNGTSCPYGTWECVINTTGDAVWNRQCCSDGWGACQHMWGQSMNSKVLLDSILAEKSDGTVIAGRGIPLEWNKEGEEIRVSNFLCENGKRIGFTMKSESKKITFTLTGDELQKSNVSLELPIFKNNISSVSPACSFDKEKGTVTIPAGIREVVVTLSE